MGLNLGLNITAASAFVLSTSTASPGDVIDILGLSADQARKATFRWREAGGGPNIPGATSPQYTVLQADLGLVIEAVVTLAGQSLISTGTVTVADPVAPTPPPTTLPTQLTLAEFSRDRTLFDAGLAVGRDSADIPLSGTADAGAVIEARIVTETGSEVAAWADIATADGAGDWSGTVSTGQNADWLRPEVRLKANPAVAATTANRFGTGLIFVFSEQSNGFRIVKDYDGLNADPSVTAQPILDPEAFQIIDLNNRGGQDDPDTGTVGNFRFVTDATPRTKPLAEMASILTRNAPGLKVLMVSDNKSGVAQTLTLRDNDDRRRFEVVEALFDAVTADGATIGAFLLSHTNSLNDGDGEYARYVAAAFLNKNLDGSTFATSLPAPLPNGNGVIDHTWLELLPGLATGDTALIVQGSGFGGIYPGTGSFLEDTATYRHLRSREELAAAFPETVILSGNHNLAYLGTTDGGNWADSSHFTALSDYGVMERARSLMALTLRDVGVLEFDLPQIDQVTWGPDYVRLGSSAGPITTVAKARGLPALNPAADPLFQGDVLGFAIEPTRQISRAVIVAPGTTTPATEGEILVYPEGGTFDGLSKLYFEPFSGGPALDSYTYYTNDGPKHRAIVDVGVDGWDGVKVQLPSDVNALNTTNALPTPSGLYVLPPNFSKYEGAWFSNTGQWTLEAEVQYPGGTAAAGLLFVKGGHHNVRLTASGDVTVVTKTNSSGSFAFTRTFTGAVADTTQLNTIRVVVDYPGQIVRLFVNDVERIDSHFGVPGRLTANPTDVVRPNSLTMLANQAGTALAHVRLWKTIEPDGSAPTDTPFVFIDAGPGNTVATSANLSEVLN